MELISPLSDVELETAYTANATFDEMIAWKQRAARAESTWQAESAHYRKSGYTWAPERELEELIASYDGLSAVQLKFENLTGMDITANS